MHCSKVMCLLYDLLTDCLIHFVGYIGGVRVKMRRFHNQIKVLFTLTIAANLKENVFFF